MTGIKTKDGRVHDADLVIMATGSWTASAIPMHGQVTATGQQLVKFKPPKSFIDIADGKDPVWSANVSVTGYYGFPPTPEGILKIGRHADG